MPHALDVTDWVFGQEVPETSSCVSFSEFDFRRVASDFYFARKKKNDASGKARKVTENKRM
jgi:hypothetical protein